MDPKLYQLIGEIGEFRLRRSSQFTPFQELLRSIVYQQLSGKAAASIFGRLRALYAKKGYPSARNILDTPEADLRACGLSRTKIKSVKDLAQKTNSRQLPSGRKIQTLTDAELIENYTAVFGIGRWTVEMLMIFNLERPDVLPASDLGIRRGFMVTYNLDEMPQPAEILRCGEQWKPYRTMASWYLWRAADRATNRDLNPGM